MHVILCILLYLHLISSPATYTTTQIDALATVNTLLINTIEHNGLLLNLVEHEYDNQANQIVIIDTTEE